MVSANPPRRRPTLPRHAALAPLALLCAAGAAPAADLAVLNWSDYVAPGVIEAFEAETGLDVRYDTYAASEPTESRLLAGGSGYDVVVVTSEYLGRLIVAGAIAPLDRARLPNLANLDPSVTARLESLDPGMQRAAPYMWGTTGLAWNEAAVRAIAPDAPTDSWALVFDPAWATRLAPCGIGIVDEPEEVLSAALLWLGRDPRSEAPDDLAAALAAVAQVAPYVRRFDSEQKGDLAEGRLCVAVAWSADALSAIDEAAEGVDLRYAIPREGAHLWVDLFVIPADAPNPQAAHRFIDHMLRPEVAAANTNAQFAANANAASRPLIEPEILANPIIHPAPETLGRLYGLSGRDLEAKRAVARAWSRIKLGLAPAR
jgi:putrescine transport system substrate-binding protein